MNIRAEASISERAIKVRLEEMSQATGLTVNLQAIQAVIASNQRCDALISVIIGKHEMPFAAEIKLNIAQVNDLGSIKNNAISHIPPIILANKMSENVRHYLRGRGIAFHTMDGHFYIPASDTISTTKKYHQAEVSQRGIRGLGQIKLAYALTRIPHARKIPVVAMSKCLNISSGLMSRSYREIQTELEITKDHHLKYRNNHNRLFFQRWALNYIQKVRSHPSISLGSFKSKLGDTKKIWQELHTQTKHQDWTWGGEPGASLIKKNLSPEEFTIYVHRKPLQLISDLKLKADPEGDIKLFHGFWFEFTGELFHRPVPAADGLILYADLMASGSSRNMDVAQLFLDQLVTAK